MSSAPLKRKMSAVIKELEKAYPNADCALHFDSAFQCLIATILSAQCTDAKVNVVTQTLFKQYPDAPALAKARVSTIETRIQSLGLYKNKAKNIVATAKMIRDEFHGEVPATLEEMVRLPGAGRKTANCVLVNAFDKPGIMCDTHCCRVSRRLGLHDETDPDKIEQQLGALMPPKEWGDFSHRIILHGRQACHARKPDCAACTLQKHCDSFPEIAAGN